MQGLGFRVFVMSALILAASGVISSSDNLSGFSFQNNAYAQLPPGASPGPDMGNPGDNMTGPGSVPGAPGADLGPPGDNTTDLGSPGGLGIPSDNATDLGPGPDVGNSTGIPATGAPASSTAGQASNPASSTVPEFGSLASAILVLSVTSIIILSAKTRIRF